PTAHAHGVDMAHQVGAESDVVRLELNGLALDVDGDHLSHSLLLDISLSLSLILPQKRNTQKQPNRVTHSAERWCQQTPSPAGDNQRQRSVTKEKHARTLT